MQTLTQREEVGASLKLKLHPTLFDNVPNQLAAVVAYVLDVIWTSPAIEKMIVLPDRFVMAQHQGDDGFYVFIGGIDELRNKWTRLLNAAWLTKEERADPRSNSNSAWCAGRAMVRETTHEHRCRVRWLNSPIWDELHCGMRNFSPSII
jgi:hypothetical protein